MKTIGILGGMSAESSALYYRLLNEGARTRLGGLHSAPCILWSVDFAEVEAMQAEGRWDAAGSLLAEKAAGLERAGAELVILATNTMHKVAPAIEASLSVPFLHIADATADELKRAGSRRPGLLATGYTMRESFYRDRLASRLGGDVIVPEGTDFDDTHRIIYEELCRGEIREDSRRRFVEIGEALAKRGADSVILGCTEIGLLLEDGMLPVPVFDTTRLHVVNALDAAMDRNAMGTAA